MNTYHRRRVFLPILLAAVVLCRIAQAEDGPGFPLVGTIKPRSAQQIASSSWSVGGETSDRDFTVYENYKRFLGPLGAKAIRLQAGWAKWDLRRMLAHRAKEIPFNLFTMMDMHYLRDDKVTMNWKGLLESRPDKTVDHAKTAYFAAQRVLAIFDDSLQRVADFNPSSSAEGLALDAYRTKEGGRAIVAVWSKAAPPTDSNATTPIDLTLPGLAFAEPLYADLLTGKVYAIPRDRWTSNSTSATFKQLPVYDSPVLIAERAALPLEPKGAP